MCPQINAWVHTHTPHTTVMSLSMYPAVLLRVPLGTTTFSTEVRKPAVKVKAVSKTRIRILVSQATSIGNLSTKAALQGFRKTVQFPGWAINQDVSALLTKGGVICKGVFLSSENSLYATQWLLSFSTHYDPHRLAMCSLKKCLLANTPFWNGKWQGGGFLFSKALVKLVGEEPVAMCMCFACYCPDSESGVIRRCLCSAQWQGHWCGYSGGSGCSVLLRMVWHHPREHTWAVGTCALQACGVTTVSVLTVAQLSTQSVTVYLRNRALLFLSILLQVSVLSREQAVLARRKRGLGKGGKQQKSDLHRAACWALNTLLWGQPGKPDNLPGWRKGSGSASSRFGHAIRCLWVPRVGRGVMCLTCLSPLASC